MKLIGYKLKKKEYKDAVTILIRNINNVTPKMFDLINNAISIKALKDAGVLDLWFEPVYEDNKTFIIEHNNGGFEVEIKDHEVMINNVHFTLNQIKKLLQPLFNEFVSIKADTFTVTINSTVHTGIKRRDLEILFELMVEL